MTEPIDLTKAREERADRQQLVPCAHCGRDIPMLSPRCPKCGVHFDGAAFQYTQEPQAEANSKRRARAITVAVLGVAAALVAAYLLTR